MREDIDFFALQRHQGPSRRTACCTLKRRHNSPAYNIVVRPGSILEVGDTVSFSAQIAPTLPSEIVVVITSPTGRTHLIEGIANKVGYFYDPLLDFTATEAGVYTASVTVTHNGLADIHMAY